MSGLPRVRGDRPRGSARGSERSGASPRARGSTFVWRGFARHGFGFPACAGIDPRTLCDCGRSSRLPRVRGDRPAAAQALGAVPRASPRARGSTHFEAPRLHAIEGFPACAGIDPGPTGTRSRSMRLPRVRGDRPMASNFFLKPGLASPRARGSTRFGRGVESDVRGFPACAGIDPLPATDISAQIAASPRARGSTPSGEAIA